MIKKLAPYTKNQLFFIIAAPLSIVFEVLIETRIPLLMADIIDIGVNQKDLDYVVRTGAVMVVMALMALLCGAMAARFAAKGGNSAKKTTIFYLYGVNYADNL